MKKQIPHVDADWKIILSTLLVAVFFSGTNCLAANVRLTVTAPPGTTSINSLDLGGINCGNGGAACASTITTGTTVTLQATSTINYTFNSWAATVNGVSTPTLFDNPHSFKPTTGVTAIDVTANFTYHAPVPGSCGTDSNGTFVSAPSTNLCSAGTSTAVTGGPTTWNWNCNGDYNGSAPACSATRNYLLTYSAGSGGTVSGSASQQLAYGGTATSVTAVPDTNYLFSNWTENGAIVSTSPTLPGFLVSASHSYVANFVAANLIISPKPTGGTVTSNVGGINCGDGGSSCIATISAGTSVTLTATRTSVNYTFNSWNLTGIGTTSVNPLTSSMPPGTLTGTATFDYHPTENGVCGTAISDTFVTTPVTNLCSSGAWSGVMNNSTTNWSWVCNGSYGGVVSPTCSAARNYLLTYTVNGYGVLGGNTSQQLPYNGNATDVVVGVGMNWIFTNWTEGATVVSTSQTLSVANVTASHDYVANFVPANLIVTPPPEGSGTIISTRDSGIICGDVGNTCLAAYPPSYQNSIAFIPSSANWVLDSWTMNGVVSFPDNPILYTLPATGTLTASAQISFHATVDGVCGADNAATIPATPVNLCLSGTASAVTGTGPWNWTCDGSYGGVSPGCSANKLVFAPLAAMTTERSGHTTTLLQNGKLLVVGGSDALGNYLATAELYDPATNLWTSAGTMASARAQHTAVVLPNGNLLVAGGSNGSGPLASAELYDPVSNNWSAVANMPTAHSGHTATLLNGGKVLIAGGSNGVQSSNAVEIYDPVLNSWSTAAAMASGRTRHTAVLLQNGKVLVAGGFGSSQLTSAELYDPATNLWSAAGSMVVMRMQHSATLLANGKVLVVGGNNQTAATELYDPVGNSWSSAGVMGSDRMGHSASLLPNGKLLVVGGSTTAGLNQINNATAELYDPTANSWALLGNMSVGRVSHTATLLSDGRVVVVGGSAAKLAESYDPAAGSWSAAGNLSVDHSKSTATLLPNGNVLVTGGQGPSQYYKSAELYNAATNSWSSAGNMSTVRVYHSATLLPNGNVLVVGGSDGVYQQHNVDLYNSGTGWSAAGGLLISRSNHRATLLPNGKVLVTGGKSYNGGGVFTASAELYDPAANKWGNVASMATARYDHSATLLGNGKVLIAGGSDSSGQPIKSAELYDPVSNSWTNVGDMATTRANHSATLLPNGKVLVAGGFNTGTVANAELFDPATNTWSAAGSMTTPKYYHAAALLPNGKVLATGGASTALSSAEQYDPASNSWSQAANMTFPGNNHTMTLLLSGKVLSEGAGGGPPPYTVCEAFDPGLGFSDARRPIISSATVSATAPIQLVLTGSGFRGDSEASSGTSASSSSGYPLVMLQRVDNQQIFYVLPASNWQWSDAVFFSAPLSGLPSGHYRVTVVVNGIPSVAKLISINTHSVSFSAGLGGTLSDSSSQYILDGGATSPVQAVPDPGYQFVNWTGDNGFVTTTNNPLTISTVTGDLNITANFVIAPINGACGPTSGVFSTSKPATGLCSIGNPSLVNGSTSPWDWTCSGMFNGTPANCSTNAQPTLRISFAGDGTGSIDSNTGIHCSSSGTCPTALFPAGTNVTFAASPGIYSVLGGWSACLGTGACLVAMNADKNLTATFTLAPLIKNLRTAQTSNLLQAAYNDVTVQTGDTLMLRINPDLLTGGLDMTRSDISKLTIKGGYDAGFSTNAGYTAMQGRLNARNGKLIVERLLIRP